jgi:hypothetical protein
MTFTAGYPVHSTLRVSEFCTEISGFLFPSTRSCFLLPLVCCKEMHNNVNTKEMWPKVDNNRPVLRRLHVLHALEIAVAGRRSQSRPLFSFHIIVQLINCVDRAP